VSLKETIETGGDWVPPRIVLYADAKFGKTSTCAQSPNPLYIGTDDGRRRLSVDGLPIPTTWEEFISQLESVASEAPELGYGSVVTDTLNGVVELCAQYVCRTQFGGSWNDPKSGFLAWGGKRGWAAVSEECRRLLPLYDRLIDAGMWVILIAHSQTEKVRDPLGGDYDRFAPAIDKNVWERFGGWADVILRGDYQKHILEDGGRKRAISDGTRILRCAASTSEVAGCRVGYELPDVLPFSWEAIADHLGKPDSSTAETLRGLLSELDKEKLNKAISWLGINDLDDVERAPLHKAKSLINRLAADDGENNNE
jgi:hypothetical protein